MGSESRKAALIEQTRINNDYLPDLTLSPSIHVTHDFQWVGTAEVLVFVVPSKGMGTVCSDLSRVTKGKGKILLTCTKGFSRETGKLMSDVLERYFPEAQAIAALSGPNLAKELAQKQPSASVIASKRSKGSKNPAGFCSSMDIFGPIFQTISLAFSYAVPEKLLCPCDRDDFGSGAW